MKEKKSGKNACCAGVDIADARATCKKLGIKHYILNFENNFKESVIDDFIESYINGQTPIPCIKCNQTVKFTDLIDFCKFKLKNSSYWSLCKKVESEDGIHLYQANDNLKDQSYFYLQPLKNNFVLEISAWSFYKKK